MDLSKKHPYFLDKLFAKCLCFLYYKTGKLLLFADAFYEYVCLGTKRIHKRRPGPKPFITHKRFWPLWFII